MKKVTLFIDSSNNQQVMVGIDINGVKHEVMSELRQRGSQVLLPLIEQVLKENRFQLADITHIQVNPGPGSYTGLRVGIAIANALAFTLGVRINDLPKGEFLKPIYE